MKISHKSEVSKSSNLVSRLLKYGLIGSMVVGSLGLVGYLNTPKKEADKKVAQVFQETYGIPIFSANPEAPSQIYVIAQRHRDPITNKNVKGKNTPKIQTEVYRIAVDLIRTKGVELVLDEGSISDKDYFNDIKRQRDFWHSGNSEEDKLRLKCLSDEGLESILESDNALIDASLLLSLNYGTDIQGAEDKAAYQEHLKLIELVDEKHDELINLIKNNRIIEEKHIQEAKELLEKSKEWGKLLRENRSAYLLVNAPDVIEREFKAGKIKTKNGIIIIGSNHIDEIVKYLSEDQIKIPSQVVEINGEKFEVNGIDRKLELKEKNYGVKVIIPRTIYNE